MNYESFDKLSEILTFNNIEEGKFDNFDVKNVSLYRSHIRKLYRDFKTELERSMRYPITEEDIISLYYLQGIIYSCFKYPESDERIYLMETYGDFITHDNLIFYLRFFDQKKIILRKTEALINAQLNAIERGKTTYKKLKKKTDIQAFIDKSTKNRSNYFSWKKSSEAREGLFNALVLKKFIEINTNLEQFKRGFVLQSERPPKDTVPYSIKWIDRNVNKTFTKKSLVYLIDELARLKIIENPITANKRNRVISYLFSHDGKTQLTRLSEDVKKSNPRRKSDIDKIIRDLNKF